jgi:hypothetical protein
VPGFSIQISDFIFEPKFLNYFIMHSYLNYLIEDIAAAHREPTSLLPAETDHSLEAHFAEVERYLSGEEPQHTFGELCGLEKAQFPPVDRLLPEQQMEVIAAFNRLLFSWNVGTDIPKELPSEIAYPLLVSLLDEKMEEVTFGLLTHEFCTYDAPSCPFGEYCACLYLDLDDPEDMDLSRPDTESLP